MLNRTTSQDDLEKLICQERISLMRMNLIGLIFLLLAILLTSYKAIETSRSLVEIETDSVLLSDFGYHSIIFREVVTGKLPHPYSLLYQQQALNAELGTNIHRMMLIGISPVGIWIWGWILDICSGDLSLAYLIWTFSVLLLFAVTTVMFANRVPIPWLRFIWYLGSALLILTDAGHRTISLGQFSLFALALLELIVVTDIFSLMGIVLSCCALLLLGFKPYYLILGVFLLWMKGGLKLALIAPFLFVITFLPFVARSGLHIFKAYQEQLFAYLSPLSADYGATLDLKVTSSLAGVLSGIVREELALRLGSICFVLSLIIAFLLLSLCNDLRNRRFAFAVILAGVFLGMPYLGKYEGLILILTAINLPTDRKILSNRIIPYVWILLLLFALTDLHPLANVLTKSVLIFGFVAVGKGPCVWNLMPKLSSEAKKHMGFTV